jgi:hypothetical protein
MLKNLLYKSVNNLYIQKSFDNKDSCYLFPLLFPFISSLTFLEFCSFLRLFHVCNFFDFFGFEINRFNYFSPDSLFILSQFFLDDDSFKKEILLLISHGKYGVVKSKFDL